MGERESKRKVECTLAGRHAVQCYGATENPLNNIHTNLDDESDCYPYRG